MFNMIDSDPNFPEQEKAVRDYWKELDIVELLKDDREDAPRKVYYDGPLTANGMPHYGHAIQWTLKDLVPRYWSMKGFYVSRNMGWDCQGIPVEFEIEKELGFESKDDIEKFGIEKFNNLCKQSVFKHKDIVYDYESRLGRWFDDSDVYFTMDATFIESMWWSLKELFKKGLLYKGHKVVAYSTRAGTPLSSHELNYGGYKDIEDDFVTVKFPLKNEKNTYFLAWTTTPWTIPGNLMLAVGKKIKYAKVLVGNKTFILATERVADIFKGKEHEIVEEISAEKLVGTEYTQPFDLFEKKRTEGCFKVIYADHVGVEEGTGIVHLAPYGAEDADIFMRVGIPIFDYLDSEAHFTSMIPAYAGLFYKKANSKIIADLEKQESLFATGKYLHRMPMCWRTDTPLIYKPVESWYIAVSAIRDKLVKANKEINWVPKHVGTGRAEVWIENARDWALSRSRYWGTPLPLWTNDKTGEEIMIGSFKELQELSGKLVTDPHKPFVDEIIWEDKKNGGTFRRTPDVIDVWYDSGAMPFAQVHYPFENQNLFETKFPAEYVSEASEQARLWFYTMLVINVALFDKLPYKNVVAHGILLDEKGKKLSKSKKNYPPMDKVFNTYGGDVLRFFILNSPVVQAEDVRFSEDMLVETRRKFFVPLWNSLKYFVTYANLFEFKPSLKRPNPKKVLDKWILVRLQEVTNLMTQNFDEYKIMEATRQLLPFVTDLSTWYIRRSRDRIKEGNKEALETLYYVFYDLARLMAPVLPFLSETIYKELKFQDLTEKESVHLELYPEFSKLMASDSRLLEAMSCTRDIVSLALSIRVDAGIKVRQPLHNLAVVFKTAGSCNFYLDLIKEEVNVKNVQVLDKTDTVLDSWVMAEDKNFKVYLETQLTESLKLEGNAREMTRIIQDLRKEKKLNVEDKVLVVYEDNELNRNTVKKFGKEMGKAVNTKSFEPGSAYDVSKV